jgi:hypothetical protein
LAAALREAGSEQPLGGDASRLPAGNALRCGALRLPRVRVPQPSTRRDVEASSAATRAITAAALIALVLACGILAGRIGQHRATEVERHEPSVATNSIEAWLRHMTITRAPPVDRTPPPVPDRL